MYDRIIDDPELLRQLEERRPQHIILGLGGITQEPLGFYLKRKLPLSAHHPRHRRRHLLPLRRTGPHPRMGRRPRPRLLWRSLSSPSRYGARYWEARRLVPLLIRYKRQNCPILWDEF